MKAELTHLNTLVLGIDTATRGGSVCLARGNWILASRVGDPAISHSNSLLQDIEACLHKAGVELREVQLFAAASGPGSFTGLRIGLATIKALSKTLRRPCLGIPTLHAVAFAAGASSATIATLPAGRGEVFAQRLSVTEKSVEEADQPAHLSPQKMLDKYSSFADLLWAGEGAQIQRQRIAEYAREKGIEFRDAEISITTGHGWTMAVKEENLSKSIAALALRRFESGKLSEGHSVTALYVRPSDAELKWP